MILSHLSRFVLKFIVSRFIAAKVNLKIVPSSSLSLLPAFPSSRKKSFFRLVDVFRENEILRFR